MAMSSLIVLLKVVTTAGGTWTTAIRTVTTAPVSSVNNPLVASIQQVAAQTSGPVQRVYLFLPVVNRNLSYSLFNL